MSTQRENFYFTMARECASIRPTDVAQLILWAREHHRLQEAQCDGVTEAEHNRVIARESKIQGYMDAMGKEFGFEPIFSGDPRGATVKLKVPSGRTDDWGQEGICVPQ